MKKRKRPKLIDELKLLKYRLIYELSNLEFNMKVKGEKTYSNDNLLNVYNSMIHDIEALIDKL